jgi:hypothetical protein
MIFFDEIFDKKKESMGHKARENAKVSVFLRRVRINLVWEGASIAKYVKVRVSE